MAFGQPAIPINPEDMMLADQMGGGQPATAPAPAKVPIQIGSSPALMDPTTGAISAPDITSTTSKSASVDTTSIPETPKIQAAESSLQDTREMAESAQKQMAAAKVQEEAFRAEQVDRENQLLKEQMAAKEEARKNEDARVADALTALRARQAEQGAFKSKTFGESMGTFRTALAAIGTGLGAWGASRGGGPNTAFDIFKAGEQAHQAKQREIIEQNAAKVEAAGGNLKAANEMRTRALSVLDEQYLQKNKFLQNMIEAKIKRIPKAAADGQAELAKLRKDYDAVEMDVAQKQAGTKTVHGPESSTTTVSGKSSIGQTGARALPSTNDIADYSTYEELDKKANRLDALTKQGSIPTPAQMDEYANQTNLIVGRQMKESHGNVDVFLGRLGRALDAIPTSAYPQNMTKEQREWLRLHTEMAHQVGVRKFGQSAMSQPESYHEFVDPLLYNRGNTIEEGAEKANALSDQMHTTFRNLRYLSKTGAREDAYESKTAAQSRVNSRSESSGKSEQPKRDYKAERSDIAEATRIMKAQGSTPRQKAAAQRFLDQFGGNQ